MPMGRLNFEESFLMRARTVQKILSLKVDNSRFLHSMTHSGTRHFLMRRV